MLHFILIVLGLWFVWSLITPEKKPQAQPVVKTITVQSSTQLLTAQAVIDQVFKKYTRTQDTQELHKNFDQWLQQVMQQFDTYEVVYLVQRALRKPVAIEPSQITSFNEFHKNYGAYVIAYTYELN